MWEKKYISINESSNHIFLYKAIMKYFFLITLIFDVFDIDTMITTYWF